MWKIKKTLLEDLCDSARRLLPKEFICLLGGDEKKQEITHFIFVPSSTDDESAMIFEHDIVFEKNLIGTLHSHPYSNNLPSLADKKFFKKFGANIILGFPFTLKNAAIYDANANKDELIIE